MSGFIAPTRSIYKSSQKTYFFVNPPPFPSVFEFENFKISMVLKPTFCVFLIIEFIDNFDYISYISSVFKKIN